MKTKKASSKKQSSASIKKKKDNEESEFIPLPFHLTFPITLEYRENKDCLLYTSPSPRDLSTSRMPSSA